MRKKINLHYDHPFWKSYDRKLSDYTGPAPTVIEEHLALAKEWYGVDLVINDIATMATVELDDEELTMFLLKCA